MDAPFRLTLLGGFRLERCGAGEVRIGRKLAALLACAAMHEQGIQRARLAALLWPDSAADAGGALRQCLYQLRSALGDVRDTLVADGDRLLARTDRVAVDVHEFRRLAAEDDLAALLQACTLYRGEFLQAFDAGADFAGWTMGERERLREQALLLLDRIVRRSGELPASAAQEAAALARRLLAQDPLCEQSWRALMRLHLGRHEPAKALQAFEQCRQALRRELGVQPSGETLLLRDQCHAACRGADTARGPQAPPVAGPHAELAQTNPPRTQAALDHLLRGTQLFYMNEPQANRMARREFEAAVALDPQYTEAIALLGWTWWFDSVFGWGTDPQADFARAVSCAARAMEVNQGSFGPHLLQGKVLLWSRRHDEALEQFQTALAMAPNFAVTHFQIGDACTLSGRIDEALRHLRRALILDPNDFGFARAVESTALLLHGDTEGALAAARSAAIRSPRYSWAHAMLAASLAELGQVEQAHASVQAAIRLNRRISVSFAQDVLPWRRPCDRERITEAMRHAGLPQAERAAAVPVT